MTPHVFDEHEHLIALKQRTAVYRAGRFVGGFLHADGIDQAIELALCDLCGGQFDLINVGHQIAEHTALAAAGGHHTVGAALNHHLGVLTGFDSGHAGLTHFALTNRPVHRDGFDLVDRIDQTLVAQKAEDQPFGLCTQGHQGHQLFFVQINGERPLGGDLRLGCFAELIAHGHGARKGRTRSGDVGLGQDRCGHRGV